ncbi:hypothetical protein DICPUDRAFT_98685 [Dictyostelium purpureum]|uniref:3',5'-cyclic-nucleotide phosphodiesterase n=1 Tax=Dictyostelium purpureum TaxID=5786 RepID=F0ZSM9_DICPU|nr:uncharacterized protein DICPUDRAFT_98685 [Dictyostelium purpureum]EGC33034.1 hypothetical protein DICPUDRAFT_98685 [Dictyostelium purpureum]|eukprot:XP_003290423.1 hypothetical protein DICPUDRAFT_98685 [Dictyostelium purpureum]
MVSNKKKILSFLVLILFINLTFSNNIDDCDEDRGISAERSERRVIKNSNDGSNFYELNDYYQPENWNYFSGSFATKDCKDASYITIPLGTTGGLDEGNLSSFLITKKGSNLFLALDAGTIWQGVRRLTTFKYFNTLFNITYPAWATLPEQRTSWFLKNHILGYFVGHSHLDHVGGLIIISPEDYLAKSWIDLPDPITTGIMGLIHQLGFKPSDFTTGILQKKTIVGLAPTINSISTNLFNNQVWPNLPSFGRYQYYSVAAGIDYPFTELIPYNETIMAPVKSQFPFSLNVRPFELCHDNLISTAFLFTDSITQEQFAFFSDTGVPSSTACDWEGKIYEVWRNIHIEKLKAIYIEVSFPDATPDSAMFGHLRPRDLMKLLDQLIVQSRQTNPPTTNLKHVKLIVEHIKPQVSPDPNGWTTQRLIYQQLKDSNTNGIRVIIPNQGDPICI